VKKKGIKREKELAMLLMYSSCMKIGIFTNQKDMQNFMYNFRTNRMCVELYGRENPDYISKWNTTHFPGLSPVVT